MFDYPTLLEQSTMSWWIGNRWWDHVWVKKELLSLFHLTHSDAAFRNVTWISVTQRESYTSVPCGDAGEFSGPELISDCLKHHGHVLWSDESMFKLVLGKNRHWVVSPKADRDHPDFHQRQVQKQTSIMVWRCISANSMGDLHLCEGTTDMEVYICIKMTSFLGSKTMPGLILHIL